jgi:L-gulonolactone oxidase
VVAAVAAAAAEGHRLRPVGSGHSFTPIARPESRQIELSGLVGPVAVDRAARLVTVPGGMPLRTLNRLLAAHHLALPNLGDIDAQTIAGAISTGTHGTGARFGGLASFVEALTLVDGRGAVIRCSATDDPDVFAAARVGLGALGIIVDVTLRCVEAFTLRADERPAAVEEVLPRIDELVAGNDHVDLYWFPYTDRLQVKRNNRVPADDRPLSRLRGWWDDELLANTGYSALCRLGRAAPRLVPAINAFSARALTPRTYTGRSDTVFCTARRVRFVEMEYGVPREAFTEAFTALRRIVASSPCRIVFPVEIRFVAADDSWLAHSYGRDTAYIAIHQYVGMPYRPYFDAFEQVATALGGRPHWGKMHSRTADSLRPAYPRFDDFLAVRDRLDPHRVFANAHLDQVLGTS